MTTEYVSATRRPEGRTADAEQKPREQRGDGSAKEIPDQSTALASDSAEPDVLLDASTVKVEEISLEVGDLRARVSLSARVGNFVTLDVGAEALLGKSKLTIKGVEAEAQLKVRLQKVYAILERTLSTIDRNPEILGRLLAPVGEAAGAIGSSVEQTLGRTVEKTVPEVGQPVGGTVEKVEKAVPQVAQAAGSTVEKVGQAVGSVVEKAVPQVEQTLGSVVEKAVPQVEQTLGSVVEKAVPQVEQTLGSVVDKTVSQVGQADGGLAHGTVDAATARRHDHSRALRVLRPIEKAARKCTTQARRAIWAARQAMRARRAAKTARRLVPSPGI